MRLPPGPESGALVTQVINLEKLHTGVDGLGDLLTFWGPEGQAGRVGGRSPLWGRFPSML